MGEHDFIKKAQRAVISLAARQQKFNASSHNQWDGFEAHRVRVARVIQQSRATSTDRLCILGAGNCNDLDLPLLLKDLSEVVLVDLDAEALQRGVRKQGSELGPHLRVISGLDLTGMLDRVSKWTARGRVTDQDLADLCMRPTQSVRPTLPAPFDLVASTCLLSPLLGNAHDTIGEAHPRFMEVVQALRTGHLRLLAELTAPGGTFLLITDVVSSTILPTIKTVPDSQLPSLLEEAKSQRNHFHGLNPEYLWASFETDPVLKSLVTHREALPPWRWSLHDRVYLVWAIRCRVDADSFHHMILF